MKVLIAAGGTGGHIYPGIAVAKEIMRRDANSSVKFVGTAHGLETKLVPDSGFELFLINSAGLKNVGFAGKVRGLMHFAEKLFRGAKVDQGVSAGCRRRRGRLCDGCGAFDG